MKKIWKNIKKLEKELAELKAELNKKNVSKEEFKVGDWVWLEGNGTGNGLHLDKAIVRLMAIDKAKNPTGNITSHFMYKYDNCYYRTNRSSNFKGIRQPQI